MEATIAQRQTNQKRIWAKAELPLAKRIAFMLFLRKVKKFGLAAEVFQFLDQKCYTKTIKRIFHLAESREEYFQLLWSLAHFHLTTSRMVRNVAGGILVKRGVYLAAEVSRRLRHCAFRKSDFSDDIERRFAGQKPVLIEVPSRGTPSSPESLPLSLEDRQVYLASLRTACLARLAGLNLVSRAVQATNNQRLYGGNGYCSLAENRFRSDVSTGSFVMVNDSFILKRTGSHTMVCLNPRGRYFVFGALYESWPEETARILRSGDTMVTVPGLELKFLKMMRFSREELFALALDLHWRKK